MAQLEEETQGATVDEGQLRRLLEVAKTLVSELELEEVLHHVLEVARELTGARYAALGILDADKRELDRFLTLGIDAETRRRIGPLPRGHGVLGELIRNPAPLRLDDVSAHPHSYGFPPEHPPMKTFLGVPIMIRGEAYGNLYLTDKLGGAPFEEHDEELAIMLSGWAGVAIANARSVKTEKMRRSIEAAERERRRWARELHDETLQELGGLKVMLDASLAAGRQSPQVIERASGRVEHAITQLQGIIADLRPAALDELGLVAAIEALVDRIGAESGIEIVTGIEFVSAAGGTRARLDPELESSVYRLVQEALHNVLKHAEAESVELRLRQDGEQVEVTVRDDGRGFDPAECAAGFGLTGMRERVALFGGELELDSEVGAGTVLRARLPARSRAGAEQIHGQRPKAGGPSQISVG